MLLNVEKHQPFFSSRCFKAFFYRPRISFEILCIESSRIDRVDRSSAWVKLQSQHLFPGTRDVLQSRVPFLSPFINFTAVDKTELVFIRHSSAITRKRCLTQYSAKASSG
mgnify:CR=1 FL=1